jgi:hypothetical protein
MEYLNYECLRAVDPTWFRQREPYPFVDLRDSLTPEGFERLRETLPDVSLFQARVGVKRAFGQGYHDRNILHYLPDVPVAEPWREFMAELHGDKYLNFVRQAFGLRPRKRLILTLEWYYAWQGCGVSPHCDARRKLATHIFYFNRDEEWPSEWGGRILILDDGKKMKTHSAPEIDELREAAALEARGNNSLLFGRTAHSWHAVRPLESPPGKLRKLFIVTINLPTIQVLWRQLRGKDADGHRFRAA